MKRTTLALACLIGLGCGSDGTDPGDDISIRFDRRSVLLTEIGATLQLEPRVTDAGGQPVEDPIVFGSLDPAVVTVSATGVVRAAGPGETRITGAIGGTADTIDATVLTVGTGPWSDITAGRSISCGLASGPTLCWGRNSSGQVGGTPVGFTELVTTPRAVPGGLGFTSVATGTDGEFTCGLTGAGAAYCWGSNAFGQLGIGTTDNDDHPLPEAVTGGLTFVTLAVGAFHACGLTDVGEAYCWGGQNSGQIGDGSNATRPSPTPVSGNHVFSTIDAGDLHTCGLTTQNTALCWGGNDSGQIGDGSISSSSVPVEVLLGLEFEEIATGGRHTCALATDGRAYCWGLSNLAQTGLGVGDPLLFPFEVGGGQRFTSIDAGPGHTCGIATSGDMFCWGDNSAGAIGDGTFAIALVPTPVQGGIDFASLGVGVTHTCGVAAGGSAFCWGAGEAGELGVGETTVTGVPALVRNPQ